MRPRDQSDADDVLWRCDVGRDAAHCPDARPAERELRFSPSKLDHPIIRSELPEPEIQVYINQENLTAPATNSQVVALGEQVNILIALAHKNAREYSRWQKKVTKVLVEVAEKLDVPTDGLNSEDEDPDDDLA